MKTVYGGKPVYRMYTRIKPTNFASIRSKGENLNTIHKITQILPTYSKFIRIGIGIILIEKHISMKILCCLVVSIPDIPSKGTSFFASKIKSYSSGQIKIKNWNGVYNCSQNIFIMFDNHQQM